MATRSLIITDIDNVVTSQYCHWDGGLNNVGYILANSYNTVNKVNKLKKLGALSVLAEKCTKPKGHSFDTPVDGYCVAYKRDRNEYDCETVIHDTLENAIESAGEMIAYIYVFTDNKWHIVVKEFLVPIPKKTGFRLI